MTAESQKPGHRFSVAPMMDWTDRHDRVFLRTISRHARLYTEMVPVGAILHGPRARFLDFDSCEHPLALQVGGADPGDLAECAGIAEAAGYDEINLNVGCPSDRVKKGRFGACLMAAPALVAACVEAMTKAAGIPVTVKTRIGIDERDSYGELHDFTARLRNAGLKTLIVHARKAWLSGLSPKQNREVPPLRYDMVYRLKDDFPDLTMVINGGIQSLEAAADHLARVDGVMLGRAAYQNPYILAEVDRRFFGASGSLLSREDIVRAMLPYVAAQIAAGVPLKNMTRHMLGLFNGLPGARAWRRHLSETAHLPGAGLEEIEEALAIITRASAARRAA